MSVRLTTLSNGRVVVAERGTQPRRLLPEHRWRIASLLHGGIRKATVVRIYSSIAGCSPGQVYKVIKQMEIEEA